MNKNLALSSLMLTATLLVGGCAVVDGLTAPSRIRQEEQDWSIAHAADTRSAYERYLQQYPPMQWEAGHDWPSHRSIEHHRIAEIRVIWLSALEENLVTRETYGAAKGYIDSKWTRNPLPQQRVDAFARQFLSSNPEALKPLLKTLKTFHDRTRLEMALISAWKGEPSIAGLKSIMALIRTDWPETEYLPRQKYQEAFIEIAAQLGPSADSTLLNDLLDPDSSCRYAAAAALVKIHSDASNSVHQEAERMLIAILEKHEPSFTLAASELIRIASKPGAALFAKAAAERDFKIIMAGLWWYVEKGIPGSEDVIGDALDRHGNRWDAELLLNCGNFILERRAAEWARQRNYQINSYPSGNLRSGQLRWGMNR